MRRLGGEVHIRKFYGYGSFVAGSPKRQLLPIWAEHGDPKINKLLILGHSEGKLVHFTNLASLVKTDTAPVLTNPREGDITK